MPRSLLLFIASGPSSIHATFRVPICMLLLEATLLMREERAECNVDFKATLEYVKLQTRILFPDNLNILDPNILNGFWFYIETVSQGR